MKRQQGLKRRQTLQPEDVQKQKVGKVSLNFFGEQNDKLYTGSKLGICLSLFAILLTVVYVVNVIIQKANHEFDNLMSVTMYNDFQELDKVYVTKHSNILPIIQINFNNLDSKFDLFEDSYSHISDPNKKKIDYNKLSQYFRVQVRMSHRKDGNEKSIIREYRLCKQTDFDKLQKQQQSKVNSLKFLCINQDDKLKEQLILKDGYIGTLEERYSFSVELLKSNLQNHKTDTEITQLLQYIVFTQYIIQDQADLMNYSNLNKSPIISRLKFLQQFQLNLQNYRDNNNFVRYNKVETQDSRYVNTYQNEYEYYDVIAQPVWYGTLAFRQKLVSYDDGVNYKLENRYLLSGQYFFLADEKLEHSRQIATYLDVMSILGGFISLVFSVTAFLTSSISYQFILLNIIKKVYRRNVMQSNEGNQQVIEINDRRVKKFRKSMMYQRNHKISDKQLSIEDYDTTLKFTTLDIITDIWLFKPLEYLFRNTRYMKNYELFRSLKSEIQGDIEVSNLVLNNKLLFLLNDEFHDLVSSQQNTQQQMIMTDEVNSRNHEVNRNNINGYDKFLRSQIKTNIFCNLNYDTQPLNKIDSSIDNINRISDSRNMIVNEQKKDSLQQVEVIEEELDQNNNQFDSYTEYNLEQNSSGTLRSNHNVIDSEQQNQRIISIKPTKSKRLK